MAWRGHGQHSERRALVLALALHAAAVLLLRHWSLAYEAFGPRSSPPTLPSTEVDIDVADDASNEGVSDPMPAPAAPERTAVRNVPSRGANNAILTAPPEAASEAVAAAEAPGSDAAPELEAAPPTGPVDLGLGEDAWQRWVGVLPKPSAPARTERRGRPVFRAPPVSSTGGLQEGLEAKDLAKGLGPSGRVVSALYQAAHHYDAPEVGAALFDVTVLRTGSVQVTLRESSDKKWQAVAAHAADALRAAPPRIPPPREGFRISVKITAEEVTPAGVKRKDLHGPRVEAVAPRFRDAKQEQKELALKNPTAGVGNDNPEVIGQAAILVDPPGVFIAGKGKTCSYQFGITVTGLILGGGCDLSGAPFQRVVRTHVEEQVAF